MNGDGVEDDIFVNFFAVDGNAAMLACDMYGVLPENLLYVPKEFCAQGGEESEQVVLVRYTMRERSRQGTFRTLLGAKSKLLASGAVEALWKERCRTLPDAVSCPRFTEEQITSAAATLDTDSESEDERQVDERGMLKPPPPPSPAALPVSIAVVAGAGETDEDGEEPTGAAAVAASGSDQDAQATDSPSPRHAPGSPRALFSDGDVTPHGASDAKRHTQRPEEDWRRHDLTDGLEGTRGRRLRSHPPRIPQAHFPRTRETLAAEVEELVTAQQQLSRFNKAASKSAHVRDGDAQSPIIAPLSARNTSLPPLSSSFSHGVSPPAGMLHSVEERNRRELAAMNRVAAVHLRSLGERYEHARSIDAEMETIPTLGTMEHMLKYQKSIGVVPEFEDRVQTAAEREELRDAARQEAREAEWARAHGIEAKEQRALEALMRERDRTRGMNAAAQETMRQLTQEKQAAAYRGQAATLNAVLRRSALRRAKADTYLETKRAAAAMSRFNHDQQEMHRRHLQETIRDVQIRKTFPADGLISGEEAPSE
ncbi:hypothetical protein NESM_000019900 [Novymonas esmeraldas]|uniref:Uncharacterized protein n=1 Tax=Novymonas esmeraldas TaxID=1808958 RepID=A0AAW0F0K8_9TRYP